MAMNLSPAAKIAYSSMIYNSIMKLNSISDFIDVSGEMNTDSISDLIAVADNRIITEEELIEDILFGLLTHKEAQRIYNELIRSQLIFKTDDQLYLYIDEDIALSGYYDHVVISGLSIAAGLTYSFLIDRTCITKHRWHSGRDRLAELTNNSLTNINKHLTELRGAGLVQNNKYEGYIQINQIS